ncbi:hypothetical protein ACQ4PT_046871 [Festuca glaucescens]
MVDPPSLRLDEDETFVRDFNASPSRNAAPAFSGLSLCEKSPFSDLDEDEDDVFPSKKVNWKLLNQKFRSGIQRFRTFQLYLQEPIQLEKAKKREAAFIVTFAKREQEIAELKSAVRDLKTQLRPPSMQIHELGMKIAVLKTQNNELRNQFDGLYKHMDGLTNDFERSNEMVSILQEKLQARDIELTRLKEMLSQKGATADTPAEEINEAADDMDATY